METEVIMERPLFGGIVRQKSKLEFLNANDLVSVGNKWRITHDLPPFNFNQWKTSNQTKEFISSLEKEFGCVMITTRGQKGGTWVHPFLFIDMALAINPSFKVEVYKWIYDCLLKYRNDSGDSYKKMAGALYLNTTKKSTFSKSMSVVCKMIQAEVGVCDWQKATESQLAYRDKIHEYISLMCGVFHNNNNEAIRIGMLKAREWYNEKYNGKSNS